MTLLSITTTTPTPSNPPPPSSQEPPNPGGRVARRGTGSHKSARYSAVKSELQTGSLDPHTLIAPEAYVGGPDLRFFCKTKVLAKDGDEKSVELRRGGRWEDEEMKDEEELGEEDVKFYAEVRGKEDERRN